MKPTVESLTQEFTRLIGPEAFAKAEAAIAAAKEAAAAAAQAAAEKAGAAAKAAAAAAAPTPSEGARPTAGAPTPVVPMVPKPAQPGAAATPARPAAPAPRPAAPAPAATPLPTLPVQATSPAAKGYDFDATVASTQVVQAAEILDRAGFALDTITGVDWIAQNEMEVVYDFFHPLHALRVVVRTRIPRATPALPTITPVFPGANWHERETHDFFGIRFLGHPNLKPFLLPEDAEFHPLRKDYQP